MGELGLIDGRLWKCRDQVMSHLSELLRRWQGVGLGCGCEWMSEDERRRREWSHFRVQGIGGVIVMDAKVTRMLTRLDVGKKMVNQMPKPTMTGWNEWEEEDGYRDLECLKGVGSFTKAWNNLGPEVALRNQRDEDFTFQFQGHREGHQTSLTKADKVCPLISVKAKNIGNIQRCEGTYRRVCDHKVGISEDIREVFREWWEESGEQGNKITEHYGNKCMKME